jgi:hypothetical protein
LLWRHGRWNIGYTHAQDRMPEAHLKASPFPPKK